MADGTVVKFDARRALELGRATMCGTRDKGGVVSWCAGYGDVEMIVKVSRGDTALTLTVGRDAVDTAWNSVNGEKISHTNRWHCIAYVWAASIGQDRDKVLAHDKTTGDYVSNSTVEGDKMAKRGNGGNGATNGKPADTAAPSTEIVGASADTLAALLDGRELGLYAVGAVSSYDQTNVTLARQMLPSAFRAEYRPGTDKRAENIKRDRAALVAGLRGLTALPALDAGDDAE